MNRHVHFLRLPDVVVILLIPVALIVFGPLAVLAILTAFIR